MKEAYHNYCKHLFEDSHSSNRKRFWSLIKHQRKDFFSYITFFTDKNTSVPNLEPSFPLISNLTFSTPGIENVLNNLSINKSPGPDCILNFVLKLCSSNIAPIFQVIFTQSLQSHTLPNDWLSANIVPIHKKARE